MNIYKGLTNSF